MNLKILGPSAPASPSHVKVLSLAFTKFLKVEYTIVICFKDQSGLPELASLTSSHLCAIYGNCANEMSRWLWEAGNAALLTEIVILWD